MDLLTSFFDAMRSAWDAVWVFADEFMNPGLFIPSLLTLVVMAVLFDKTSSTLLNYIVLVFLGAAVYFMIVSFDFVADSTYGAAIAFILGIVAMLTRIGVVWKQAGKFGKAFTVFATVGLVAGILAILGRANPDLVISGEVSAVISRTGEFANQLFESIEEGAPRVVR